ncbi:MAG: hypothetical protein GY856_30880 [bacterium]|nr:hypothetical protein [bacterium]
MDQKRRDTIAQWTFDCHSVLGRFHLWLEDVSLRRTTGDEHAPESFVGAPLERAFIMAAAVTALGTWLFGRYGEARGLDKSGINRVKKDADALSSYALSEALWYLTRSLPENHAVMVSLGEGLMPKAGESPEMGSNPLLGFGRVYARPQVGQFLDHRVHRLLNERDYGWDEFWQEVRQAGITIWGAAIDTLENTSRFAKGKATGPMTVLHLFDQPLRVSRPYEGYVGNLILPRKVVDEAAERSVLLSFQTPRRLVLDAIRSTYPEITPERVHVWTLGGESRETRLGALWREWSELGVHLVEDGWEIPGGGETFNESGTYAPLSRVGTFTDDGNRHLFLCDGYAASAEAIQGASLDPILGSHSLLSLFSSKYKAPHHREAGVMRLDPESPTFTAELHAKLGRELPESDVGQYREAIRAARDAGMPIGKSHVTIDDFLPFKQWRLLAVTGFMLPDPYSGCPGVEEVAPSCYRVTVRAANRDRVDEVEMRLRLLKRPEESRMVFSPLLERFTAGEDHRRRAVKTSDSGRIRNELQTLCMEALEYSDDGGIRVHFDRIDDQVLPAERKERIREVLEWYKTHHPVWFQWLEIAP